MATNAYIQAGLKEISHMPQTDSSSKSGLDFTDTQI